eukprot:s1971_g1.t1
MVPMLEPIDHEHEQMSFSALISMLSPFAFFSHGSSALEWVNQFSTCSTSDCQRVHMLCSFDSLVVLHSLQSLCAATDMYYVCKLLNQRTKHAADCHPPHR